MPCPAAPARSTRNVAKPSVDSAPIACAVGAPPGDTVSKVVAGTSSQTATPPPGNAITPRDCSWYDVEYGRHTAKSTLGVGGNTVAVKSRPAVSDDDGTSKCTACVVEIVDEKHITSWHVSWN